MGYAYKEHIDSFAKVILTLLSETETGHYRLHSNGDERLNTTLVKCGITDDEFSRNAGCFDCAIQQLHDQSCIVTHREWPNNDDREDTWVDDMRLTDAGRNALAHWGTLSF